MNCSGSSRRISSSLNRSVALIEEGAPALEPTDDTGAGDEGEQAQLAHAVRISPTMHADARGMIPLRAYVLP